MSEPIDFWERCPLCRARLRKASECPRCGLDFSPMLETADEAKEVAGQAMGQLGAGRSREAFHNAAVAVQMHHSPDTLKSLALTAVARRHFALALAIWLYLKEHSEGGTGHVSTGEQS